MAAMRLLSRLIAAVLAVGLVTQPVMAQSILRDAETEALLHDMAVPLVAATLLPAALMMLLPLLKVPIRHAMGWSVLAAAAVTLLVQRMDVWEMLKAVVMGYVPADAQMARIVSGGGLVSMWKPALLVFTTALYSGILDGTGVMRPLQKRLEKPAEKWGLFPVMTAVSLLRNYTRGQLLQMAERARAQAKPDAVAEVAQAIEDLKSGK